MLFFCAYISLAISLNSMQLSLWFITGLKCVVHMAASMAITRAGRSPSDRQEVVTVMLMWR